MRVNSIGSYLDLVEPKDPDIVKLAKQFRSYEETCRFLSDEIKFVPSAPSGPVKETLQRRVGSRSGKAVLLCSIYRARGLPKRECPDCCRHCGYC